MNELIRELAVKAGDDWDHTLQEDREFLVKFAELVVRECASIAQSANLEDVDGGDSAVLRAAANQIKEHFGL